MQPRKPFDPAQRWQHIQLDQRIYVSTLVTAASILWHRSSRWLTQTVRKRVGSLSSGFSRRNNFSEWPMRKRRLTREPEASGTKRLLTAINRNEPCPDLYRQVAVLFGMMECVKITLADGAHLLLHRWGPQLSHNEEPDKQTWPIVI